MNRTVLMIAIAMCYSGAVGLSCFSTRSELYEQNRRILKSNETQVVETLASVRVEHLPNRVFITVSEVRQDVRVLEQRYTVDIYKRILRDEPHPLWGVGQLWMVGLFLSPGLLAAEEVRSIPRFVKQVEGVHSDRVVLAEYEGKATGWLAWRELIALNHAVEFEVAASGTSIETTKLSDYPIILRWRRPGLCRESEQPVRIARTADPNVVTVYTLSKPCAPDASQEVQRF